MSSPRPPAPGSQATLEGVPGPVVADPGAAGEAPLGPTGRPVRPVPEPEPLTSHGPAQVVAMCNQKGGVGKTTSTINLGAALAEAGRRVLLVDLDPQGALSAGLGVNHNDLELTVHNLLIEPRVSDRKSTRLNSSHPV